MRISGLLAAALGAVVCVLAAGAMTVGAEEPAGKQIFLDAKCNKCHTVEAAGITAGESEEEAEEEEVADEDSTKREPPDLSGVGLKHEADWMASFLMKREELDGRKHKKRFGGKKAELDTLVEWLSSLKTEPAE